MCVKSMCSPYLHAGYNRPLKRVRFASSSLSILTKRATTRSRFALSVLAPSILDEHGSQSQSPTGAACSRSRSRSPAAALVGQSLLRHALPAFHLCCTSTAWMTVALLIIIADAFYSSATTAASHIRSRASGSCPIRSVREMGNLKSKKARTGRRRRV